MWLELITKGKKYINMSNLCKSVKRKWAILFYFDCYTFVYLPACMILDDFVLALYFVICDVIKQNESELANIDF